MIYLDHDECPICNEGFLTPTEKNGFIELVCNVCNTPIISSEVVENE